MYVRLSRHAGKGQRLQSQQNMKLHAVSWSMKTMTQIENGRISLTMCSFFTPPETACTCGQAFT